MFNYDGLSSIYSTMVLLDTSLDYENTDTGYILIDVATLTYIYEWIIYITEGCLQVK